jgi:hypothetical protein
MTAAGQPGQRQREQVPPAATPPQGIPLIVDRGGTIHTVYDERIDLTRIGALSIRRGSYVEPTPTGQWTADLAPCDGPLLGPFASRGDAIAAELAWLVEHWLDSVTGSLGTLPERR